MAAFNAWCDRTPVMVFGATGVVDAAKRRPWIEWIHNSKDQGALVLDYTQWDNRPASLAAAAESMLGANMIAQNVPKGPVYVYFDVSMQEEALPAPLPMQDMSRFKVPAAPRPAPDLSAPAPKGRRGSRCFPVAGMVRINWPMSTGC